MNTPFIMSESNEKNISTFEREEISINVNTSEEVQTVSARELYQKLEINHRFSDWFSSLLKYGFEENRDFTSVLTCTLVNNGAKRELTDYAITIEMAKQICMIQRSDAGRKYREYFLKLEAAWNSPEMVMKRALQIADKKVEEMQKRIFSQNQLIEEQKPKVEVYDSISDSSTLQELQTVAQTIGLVNVFKILVADHILEVKFTEGDGIKYYKPYAEYREYFELKDGKAWTDNKGIKHIRPRVFVTGKGLVWLAKKYKAA